MRLFAAAFFLLLTLAHADDVHPDYAELVRAYDYDRTASLDVKEFNVEQRGDVRIIDISYASPKGGRVPAYVVLPVHAKPPYPVILWGHWMMPGSPLKNRKEFVDEAVVMARSGAASLLIDNPLVRPGAVVDHNPLSPQEALTSQQMVVDFRRGIDVMVDRYRGNPALVGYVGHSFEAHVGAILTAVDKRIKASVLMAGVFADQEYVLTSQRAQLIDFRRTAGEDRIRAFFRKYAWDDAAYFAPHSAPAYVFLQFGNGDFDLNGALAKHYFDLFEQPKKIGFYEAGHALNAAARRDRLSFLQELLSLEPVDMAAADKIPQLQ